MVFFVPLIACHQSRDLGPSAPVPANGATADAGPPRRIEAGVPDADRPADDPTTTCAARGGARLKARFYKTDDGVTTFFGFWDTKRDEACRFTVAWDGKVRCLPDNPPFIDERRAFSGNSYSDALCSNRTTETHSVYCKAPRYALSADMAPAGAPLTCLPKALYLRGAQLPLPVIYERMPSGTCVPMTPAAAGSPMPMRFAPPDQIVAADEFVEGIEVPASGAVVGASYQGSDGSLQPGCAIAGWPLHDTRLDAQCRLDWVDGGKLACQPSGLSMGDAFADSACTVPTLPDREGPGCRSTGRFSVRAPGCSSALMITRVGERVNKIWRRMAGTCVPAAIRPGEIYFEQGKDTQPYEAQEMKLVAGPGSRLRPRTYQAVAGGTRAFSGFFDDERFQEICQIVATPDGNLRCLPSAGFVAEVYTDAGCTAPLLVGRMPPPEPDTGRCKEQPPVRWRAQTFVVRTQSKPCQVVPSMQWYRVNQPLMQPLYSRNSAACVRDPAPSFGVTEVPLVDFALVEELRK